jgi:mono/diheme cytochrome c family protein
MLAALAAVAVMSSSIQAQGAKPAGKPAAKAATKPAAKPAKPSGPSTLSGIYTDAQATRGRYVYTGTCRSCHSPTSHTGATFAQWWRGKQLSDLFTFIGEKMPKNDPGTLAPEDVADVVAYLLKMNAMPVGKNEIYPDVDSLKQFRIEVKSSGTSTTKRKKP